MFTMLSVSHDLNGINRMNQKNRQTLAVSCLEAFANIENFKLVEQTSALSRCAIPNSDFCDCNGLRPGITSAKPQYNWKLCLALAIPVFLSYLCSASVGFRKVSPLYVKVL